MTKNDEKTYRALKFSLFFDSPKFNVTESQTLHNEQFVKLCKRVLGV